MGYKSLVDFREDMVTLSGTKKDILAGKGNTPLWFFAYLLLFASGLSSLPETSFAQNTEATVIIVDNSESMGRGFPSAPQVSLVQAVNSALNQWVFTTNLPYQMPAGFPVAEWNAVSANWGQQQWLTVRYLGGVRTKEQRSCDISSQPNYFGFEEGQMNPAFTTRPGWCMASDWDWTPGVYPGVYRFGRTMSNAFRNPLASVKPTDWSIVGKGIVRVLQPYITAPNNPGCGPLTAAPTPGIRRVLVITDGGEGCNRERADQNGILDVLSGVTPYNSYNFLNDPRIMFWFLVVDPLSQDDANRFQQIVQTHNNNLIAQGKNVMPQWLWNQSRFSVAENPDQVMEQVKSFVIRNMVMPRMPSSPLYSPPLYDPCASCFPTPQQKCDCCVVTNASGRCGSQSCASVCSGLNPGGSAPPGSVMIPAQLISNPYKP